MSLQSWQRLLDEEDDTHHHHGELTGQNFSPLRLCLEALRAFPNHDLILPGPHTRCDAPEEYSPVTLWEPAM